MFGGTLIDIKELQKRVLQRLETIPALDYDNIALLLNAVLEQAEREWGLVWPGDHVLQGDWELDRNEPWVRKNEIAGVACFGDLTIDGDLLIRDDLYWPPLFVAGTLRVRNLIKGGPPLFVLGDLHISGYYVGVYNDGPLRVGGNLTAAGYIYRCRDEQGIPGHLVAGRIEARAFDARAWPMERRKIREAFVPEVIVGGWFNEDQILAREHAGLPVWRDPADVVEEPPPPPPPPIPETQGVDPVALGTLMTAPEVEAYIADWNEEMVPELRADLQRRPDERVLLLPHGTHLPGDLELDWDGVEWVNRDEIVGIVCEGDLTLDGDVLNWEWDFGPFLFVKGDLRLRNLIKAGSPVRVQGDVETSGLVIGEYNHGSLDVGGDLAASAYILLDQSGAVGGEIKAPALNDRDDDLRDLLDSRAFAGEWDTSPESKLLWALQRAGIEVLLERA